MSHTIKIVSRWDSTKVLYTFEATDEQQASGMAMRAALEAATVSGANLTDADLTRANLTGANLTDAVLTPIRDDLWAVLSSAPREAQAVLDALRAGRVDGSTYTGECACLVGTIANARHCDTYNLGALKADSHRPAEVWFMQIKPGHTPENHEPSRLAAEWVDQWLVAMRTAFSKEKS